MKGLNVLLASLALACCALFPASTLADDELDVMVTVIDDLSDIDGDMARMSGPGDDEEGASEPEEEVTFGSDELVAEAGDDENDGFENDASDSDDTAEMEEEDEFEEGEDVDDDVDDDMNDDGGEMNDDDGEMNDDDGEMNGDGSEGGDAGDGEI